MKINFVSYLNPFAFNGGGEQVNKAIVQAGMARGHNFSFTSVKNRQDNFKEEFDIDFIVDFFNFPHTLKSGGAWRSFSESFLNRILNRNRFVHMSNAYADICNLGYLPCNGKASNPCTIKKNDRVSDFIIRKEFSSVCFSRRTKVQDLFKKSQLNFYVSPLHQKTVNEVMGLNDFDKSIIIPPIIDTEKFRNLNLERDIDYLFVGVISKAKGYFEMRDRFRNENIFLIGSNPFKLDIDFGTYLGSKPYSQIPQLMNRAKNFVFLPNWPEPQGRVVVEAALSGCNLIVNENVGALTFPFDISKSENIRNSVDVFWNEFEQKVYA